MFDSELTKTLKRQLGYTTKALVLSFFLFFVCFWFLPLFVPFFAIVTGTLTGIRCGYGLSVTESEINDVIQNNLYYEG